jgi:protein involved in polysaccharide export with SLBB domain
MKFAPFSCSRLAITCLSLLMANCSTVRRVTDAIPVPDLHLPKVKMPDLSGVTKLVPGMDRDDSMGSDDPKVPFHPASPLAPGHTLRLQVFDAGRASHELWKGLVQVDASGVVSFDDLGSAKVGGRSADEARQMIAAVFRAAGRVANTVRVHLISVENFRLIAVDGDVAGSVVLPYGDKMKVSDALQLAGGRRARSSAQAVYVSQQGQRKFFRSEVLANEQVRLSPGDVITLSSDL